MRKVYQCIQNENKMVNPIQTIDAIKKAGFDGVFAQWYDRDWEISQQEQMDYCKSLGLDIVFAHLGYDNINSLWYDGELGDRETENYIQNLKDMKKYNIPMVVMHLMVGKDLPPLGEIGLNRFRRIISVAEELGIKIAFENTRAKGYLEYIFDNIKSDYVGVCFDIGHYHCHFKDEFDWDYFKGKIIALHTHDNNGEKDEHLLPFEGTVDWEDTIKKIKDSGYNGPITLESCYRREYKIMTIDEFYKKSYKTAKLLNEMFDKV